jgi:uncharacterized metal-binding protein YceD (DUF177 family)
MPSPDPTPRHETVQPEFSRPVSVSRLPPGGRFPIEASEGERAALARRFGLQEVGRLVAEVRLTRLAGAAVRLDAKLEADVVQSCVVTLDPVPAHVTDTFTVVYTPNLDQAEQVELTAEEEDVERLDGDTIDIGEAVAQQLSLALDPYPHAPGAALPAEAGGGRDPADHPFAALAKIKR